MNHDELLAEGRKHAGTSVEREIGAFARGYADGVKAAMEHPAKFRGAGVGGNGVASIEQIDRDAIYAQWNSPKGKGQERPGDTR